MQYIDVAGTPTRCVTAGDRAAPPLLLLHGLALTAEVWLRNIDALSRSHRVIAIDMLSHGFTRPAEEKTVDVPAKLRHLKDLADVLELDRLSLCGSSYGALMASLFFLENPERVDKLVINGSGSCFNTEEQLKAQVGKMQTLYGPDLVAGSSTETWRERIGNNFHDISKVPDELPLVAQLCYAQPWAPGRLGETITIMQDLERFRPYRILERLEELTCPSLVVWGMNDHGGSLESAKTAVGRLPKGRLVVFDNCGHYPMLEHPEEYNRLVADFLTRAEG